MADILRGSARTMPRVRAELQASKATTGSLARQYGLSRTTVAKWRARTTTADAPMGPRDPKSTVLTPVEEAMIVEFRRWTLLPLDDVLGCLRDSIPQLTRSSFTDVFCDTASLACRTAGKRPPSEDASQIRRSATCAWTKDPTPFIINPRHLIHTFFVGIQIYKGRPPSGR
jgi:hypothetical protein